MNIYIDLMVSKTAEVIKKYGSKHSRSLLVLRMFDKWMEKKPDLKCHCSQKNPHYCALSQAFKFIKFESEDDLFVEDNLLVLKLLFNGATYRNLENCKEYKWKAINILNSYIEAKKTDVIELLKVNRHVKHCPRETTLQAKYTSRGKLQKR